MTDGVTYVNPTPGAASNIKAVANGFYQVCLYKNGTEMKIMLAKDQATAEAVMALESMQLLFDEQNVIIGIAP